MLHSTWRSWAHLFCVCFCVCGRQKPKDPQLELHGWRRHYTGLYRRSGISGVYLWFDHNTLSDLDQVLSSKANWLLWSYLFCISLLVCILPIRDSQSTWYSVLIASNIHPRQANVAVYCFCHLLSGTRHIFTDKVVWTVVVVCVPPWCGVPIWEEPLVSLVACCALDDMNK